ncbi:MAG: hypothetical protein JWM53_6083, partial [bacterium]|nr:hypothetical protein [bacterium]
MVAAGGVDYGGGDRWSGGPLLRDERRGA